MNHRFCLVGVLFCALIGIDCVSTTLNNVTDSRVGKSTRAIVSIGGHNATDSSINVGSTTTATVTIPTSSTTSTPSTSSSTESSSRPEDFTGNVKKNFKKQVKPSMSTKHSQFKWNSVVAGEQNSLSYKLNCTTDYMTIEVNLTSVEQPFVYLEKLKTFSICRPKIVKNIATFHLSLDDDFYRCGTIKVHDQVTGSRVYYNRVIVESKTKVDSSKATIVESKSVYFKCSLPNVARILAKSELGRNKRASGNGPAPVNGASSSAPGVPLGAGRLVNFTEIDLPDNFMEAEILDFGEPITQRAPYPHLNIKVKRNGQFVNTSLNVAPGTPLEMIIYLDDKSKHVYGLLGSFMKVTDNGPRQREEVIVLNGCSVDPYIFGNFETDDSGDSISARFRAFKFPESNYVMFAGTVNVCLDKCTGVTCGNDIVAYGRRRRRSVNGDPPKDPNKMFEIEMVTYLQVGYSPSQLEAKKNALRGNFDSASEDTEVLAASTFTENNQKPTASKLTKTDNSFQGEARPVSSRYEKNSSLTKSPVSLAMFVLSFSIFLLFSQL